MYANMGSLQEVDVKAIVSGCLDAGITLFDTADVYSDGLSEELLGRALSGSRQNAIIATKCFGRAGKGDHDAGLSRRHILSACEASLKRLGTDWIDLYQVHGFDAQTPQEETARALETLIQDGKVRYVGCSNHSGWHLMKALMSADAVNCHRYVSQQIQYSLLAREVEYELLPAGIDQGVSAIVWGPLAAGYLTGKYQTKSLPEETTRLGVGKRLDRIDSAQARKVVTVLAEIAAARGVSSSQVALAWTLGRRGVASVLLGARNLQQLEGNLAAATLKLSSDEIERLDRTSQAPMPYPYSHQQTFALERNPPIFATYRD